MSPEQREEHEMELDQLEGERIHAAIEFTDRENANLVKAVERLEQQKVALVSALKAVEWLDHRQSDRCPWCWGVRPDYPYSKVVKGHKLDCQRQQALAQAGE